MVDQSSDFERKFGIKAYFVYLLALYMFFYRLISHSMLSQLSHPLFMFNQTEWYYMFLQASHLPQLITGNAVLSALADVSILVYAILFLLSFRRLYAVLFSVMVLFYFSTYNLVTGHHYHSMVGLLVISVPFWFKDEERFNNLWQLVRYYFLYLFASAAFWKIFRGSVFYTEQLSNILKSQQLNLLLQNPDSIKAHIAQYLIANPQVSHVLLIATILLQLSFLSGFFTRRFDMILFWLAIVFCVANYLVMGIISFELLILNLTLLDWEKVEIILVKRGIV
jgi:hypothetical protein